MRQAFLLIFLTSTPAAAQSAAVDDWFRFMAETNTGSALESAGSKGSFGTSISAGIQNQKAAADTLVSQDQLRPQNKIYESTSQMSFVALHKGTPWPLDIGINAGQTGDSDIKRFGLTAQWTWIQIPLGPSLSTRVGHFTTQGYKSSQIQSSTADLVGGFGYGYVTGYVSAGAVSHQAELDVADSQVLRLALRDANETVERRTWQQLKGSAGLQVRLGSPFITSTVEWTYVGETYRGISAKLAIGL